MDFMDTMDTGSLFATSNKKLLGAPGIATSNKGITTRNKKLLETRTLLGSLSFSLTFQLCVAFQCRFRSFASK